MKAKIRQPLIIILAFVWLLGISSPGMSLWIDKVEASKKQLQTVDAEKIKEVVREFVYAHLLYSPQDIILEFHRVPEDISVPAGKVDLKVLPGKRGDLKGNVVIILEIFVNDEIYEKKPISVKIRTFENVVVAKNRINRHQIIKAEDVAIERRETTSVSRKVITRSEKVIGKRTRGIINPGRILDTGLIESPPIIKRGAIVNMIVKSGNVTVRTVGRAMEDGRQDEWIIVQNIKSRKRLMAQVQDAKTVLVNP